MLGAVRAAELRSSSMASILSNRTDSGCVTRSAPFSASRTASRFWFCQPFSDLLGPLLTFDFSQQTRDFLGVSDLAGRLRRPQVFGSRSPTSWVASRRSVPLGGHRRLVVPGWHGLRFMVAGCAPVAVSAAGARVSVLPDRACVLQVRRLGRCGAVRSGRPSCARRGVRRRAPGASGSSCLIGYEPFLRIGSAPVSNSTSARWIGFKA